MWSLDLGLLFLCLILKKTVHLSLKLYSKRLCLFYFSSFQGLDVLAVALGLQGLQLLHKLFVDLQIEGVMPNIGGATQQQQVLMIHCSLSFGFYI